MYKAKIDIDEIEIPVEFQNSTPNKHKITQRINHYRTYGTFPKIIIREDTKRLLDGYASYVAAKKIGVTELEATYLPAKEAIHYVASSVNDLSRSKEITKRIRVMKEKGDKCYICGRQLYDRTEKEFDGTNELTIDHKIPLFKGGSNIMDNLYPCCNICNGLKGDFTYSDELVALIHKELKGRKLL